MRALSALLLVLPVLAATAGGKSVELARQELKTHLRLAVGSDAPEGWTFRFERPEGAPEAAEFESAYRIDGKTVWFWGDDRGSGRQQRWGTLFAVELFAERELGIVWMWPGDDGTFVKRRDRLELKGPRTERFVQPLEKGEFRNYSKAKTFRQWEGYAPKELRTITEENCAKGYADRDIWLKRHRLQDRMRAGYGHAFTDWRGRFLKTHPEYLNLHAETGERGWVGTAPTAFVKLCTSNEDVVDQIISDWVARGTNAYLNVCENDGSFYCECANCRAKDADLPGEKPNHDHLADRYVDFWNRIAKKAVAIRPDVTLIAYAYSDYRFAPRRTRILYPDNMLFGFVPSIMDDCEAEFAKWRDMGMKHFFLRPNFHCFWGTIPRGLERFLYENFHNCLKLGMIGVDYDSNLGRYPMHLESYVTARMISDPEASFETICGEFYSGYGAAAQEVRRYFEEVRADGEKARAEFMSARAMPDGILDDSQLSCMQAYGRSETRLAGQLALLKGAYRRHRGRLSPEEDLRLRQLVAAAGHAVATFRFHTAQNLDKKTFEDRGRDLIRFRKKYRDLLPDDYGGIFGRWEGELRTWIKTDFWRAEVDGGEIDGRGVAYGWRCNFERPGFPLGWRPRDCLVAITNDCASTGDWSVKFFTQEGRWTLAIWQCYTKIVPGARYAWSADWKADAGVSGVSMRVVARPNEATGEKGYDVVNKSFYRIPSDAFTTCTVEFTAPTNRGDSVLFYASVGQGGEGKYVWLDNLKLEMLK